MAFPSVYRCPEDVFVESSASAFPSFSSQEPSLFPRAILPSISPNDALHLHRPGKVRTGFYPAGLAAVTIAG